MFATFSKNQQLGELFQKRFAIGICDLKGAPCMNRVTPYTIKPVVQTDALRLAYYISRGGVEHPRLPPPRAEGN